VCERALTSFFFPLFSSTLLRLHIRLAIFLTSLGLLSFLLAATGYNHVTPNDSNIDPTGDLFSWRNPSPPKHPSYVILVQGIAWFLSAILIVLLCALPRHGADSRAALYREIGAGLFTGAFMVTNGLIVWAGLCYQNPSNITHVCNDLGAEKYLVGGGLLAYFATGLLFCFFGAETPRNVDDSTAPVVLEECDIETDAEGVDDNEPFSSIPYRLLQ